MKSYKKLIENIKWNIIIYLDNKYPEACWANLVHWQIGIASFTETFGKESRWNDQGCCEEYGGAYCGKCVRTGRLKD